MMNPLAFYSVLYVVQAILCIGIMTAYAQKGDKLVKLSSPVWVYIYATSFACASLPIVGVFMIATACEDARFKLSYSNPFNPFKK